MNGSIRRFSAPRIATVAALAASTFLFLVLGSGPASAAAGSVKEFRIPPPSTGAEGIAVGPDGAVWFTQLTTSSVGRLGTGGFSSFATPSPGYPDAIVNGPDGALWFSDLYNARISTITTSGRITEFDLPPCGSCGEYGQGATSLALGPDGALWFTRPAESVIGRMTTDGHVTEFTTGGPIVDPSWIANGPDGALWFTDETGIGRITTDGTATQVWSGLNYPSAITAGPDGNLWVTGSSQDVVARVTTAGRAKLFTIHLNCDPQQIAPGAGALWATCYNLNEIQRITTAGQVTGFPVPGHIPNYPDVMYGIVQGPGAAMWFTEYAAGRIGRMSTA